MAVCEVSHWVVDFERDCRWSEEVGQGGSRVSSFTQV